MVENTEGRLEKIAQLLIEIGVPKNSAKALAYILLKGSPARTVEIEGKTGMRQPEVSLAVKHLRSTGWVKKSEVEKQGKGRPVHEYALAMSPQEFIGELEKLQKKKIQEIEESLSSIKEEILK
jgi:predicted transcriptional regulator